MAELIAQGKNERDQWRRRLPDDQPVLLGRDVGDWSVPWDQFISRRHAEAVWTNGRLKVQRLPRARNPIFLRGEESNAFELPPGELFVIGETTFRVVDEKPVGVPTPQLQEMSISGPELQRIPVRDAAHQLDVLSRLPEVISGSASDAELFGRLGPMLLAGVRRADVAAVVMVDDADAGHPRVQVLHAEHRQPGGSDFQPSHRLVLETIVRRRQTVAHAWGEAEAGTDSDYTAPGTNVWAFCTPVPGEACRNWGLYLTGRFVGPDLAAYLSPLDNSELGDELKFIELVAQVLNALRQLQFLQRREDSLTRFFSPVVLRALRHTSAENALKPRETEVTVVYCGVHGPSEPAKTGPQDLLALLERARKALGFMTQTILDQGGVVGDFHGEGAMGFWGWPIAQEDQVARACLAALGIRQQFEASARRPDHPLQGFHACIGLATGRAVAGQIGTTEQVKITAFGPVVELAARLEGMTQALRAPILLDAATARLLSAQLSLEAARCRRLLQVRAPGLDTPLMVSELLPPAAEYPQLSDEDLATYEAALDAFLAGRWDTAYELLHRIPPQDRGKDFLLGAILRHNHTPPPGWEGTISLDEQK